MTATARPAAPATNIPIRLATIIASTRPGRFGPVAGNWFAGLAAARDDVEHDLIDLLEVGLPATFPSEPNDAVDAYLARIDRADAFVVVTPEYNHGYPAPLKQAIDLAGVEWRRKAVGFVSYGGFAGGTRAVEQLRPVFAELHCTSVREMVSFHQFWERFDERGQPRDAAAADAAATVMLDDLVWWASALRTARRGDEAQPDADLTAA